MFPRLRFLWLGQAFFSCPLWQCQRRMNENLIVKSKNVKLWMKYKIISYFILVILLWKIFKFVYQLQNSSTKSSCSPFMQNVHQCTFLPVLHSRLSPEFPSPHVSLHYMPLACPSFIIHNFSRALQSKLDTVFCHSWKLLCLYLKIRTVF